MATIESKKLVFEDHPVVFAQLTGKGRKGKNKKQQYMVAIGLDKKQAKAFENQLDEFWEENKPSKADEPDHDFHKWVKPDENKKGQYVVWFRVNVDNVAGKTYLYAAKGKGFTKKHFDNMGAGSIVDVSANLVLYENDGDYGLSLYLRNVRLKEFIKYEAQNDFDGDDSESIDNDDDAVDTASDDDDVDYDEIIEDFKEALEDEDFDEAKELLEELEDHPDYKKFKKQLRKAKG